MRSGSLKYTVESHENLITGVSQMKITYINNDGAGYADHLDVAEGTTVSKLFDHQIDGKPTDYLIRVNRQPVTADYVLHEGDRVSFTPTKIEGARR